MARRSWETLPFGFPFASRTNPSTNRIALSNQTGSRLSRSNSTNATAGNAFFYRVGVP
jgi:hypothetical protein